MTNQPTEFDCFDKALYEAQVSMVRISKSCWQAGDTTPTGTVDQQWIDETRTQLKYLQDWLDECQSANESMAHLTIAGETHE